MKKASLHGLAFRNDVDLDGDELKAPITELVPHFHVWDLSLVQPTILPAPCRIAEGSQRRNGEDR